MAALLAAQGVDADTLKKSPTTRIKKCGVWPSWR
jgi:hypothetical protein